MTGFIRLLDKYGIHHDDEERLRQVVRSKPTCLSRAKQLFLRPGMEKQLIQRKDAASVYSLGCICIPTEDVPEEFYSNLPEVITHFAKGKGKKKKAEHLTASPSERHLQSLVTLEDSEQVESNTADVQTSTPKSTTEYQTTGEKKSDETVQPSAQTTPHEIAELICKIVARGIISDQERVHGNVVGSDETAVQVTEALAPPPPGYNEDSFRSESFIIWPKRNIKMQGLQKLSGTQASPSTPTKRSPPKVTESASASKQRKTEAIKKRYLERAFSTLVPSNRQPSQRKSKSWQLQGKAAMAVELSRQPLPPME